MHSPLDDALKFTRRDFLASSAGTALLLPQVAGAADRPPPAAGPQQATGTRVGEVDQTSAIVWTRLTKYPQRNNDGVVFSQDFDRKDLRPTNVPVDGIEGACPGMPGRVRVRYGLREDLSDALLTPWAAVTAASDFIHQFKLAGLQRGSTYHYVAQAAAAGDSKVSSEFRGRFSTAPNATAPSDFRFCVMTCQGYQDRDHADGHPIYPAMKALEPKFVVMTGDLVYYDNDAPRAVTPVLARLHWQRMFSLPRLITMMRSTSSYWLKDDHDTLSNDSWPGMRAGELSFAQGQQIFHEQAPMGPDSYRTFRWGRDLQIWFSEGRDFRSPNKMPDGPAKTIWGAEQKAWFKRTVAESNATWKVLVSPTPLVGPDRPKKNDNHSNEGFAYEGREIRNWLKAHAADNFFVICGDRHWQYHSVHPETGTQEYSVGPASDSHAGGAPGENKAIHRFHRVQGGFLSVELRPMENESQIAFQLRDVAGAVVYEAKYRRAAAAC
ncbi:MAG TPA: alkaline phosphatase D family protein [Pirellulales bacterium]|nr:alkaline phosphatase D family protein [Pirellulales bacterium]